MYTGGRRQALDLLLHADRLSLEVDRDPRVGRVRLHIQLDDPVVSVLVLVLLKPVVGLVLVVPLVHRRRAVHVRNDLLAVLVEVVLDTGHALDVWQQVALDVVLQVSAELFVERIHWWLDLLLVAVDLRHDERRKILEMDVELVELVVPRLVHDVSLEVVERLERHFPRRAHLRGRFQVVDVLWGFSDNLIGILLGHC